MKISIVALLLITLPTMLFAQSTKELVEEKASIMQTIESLEERLAQIDAALTEVSPEDKLEAMISKYGKNKGRLIANGKVWPSISYDMARDSWGDPTNIQKTQISSGETQKWSYSGGRYLYFKNGRLESWKE